MTLAQMLGSRSRDELDIARIVHPTLIVIDDLVLLVLPRKPTRLVALEADLVDVDGVADDRRLKPKLNGIGRWRNPVFKQLNVDVFHHLHRVLFSIVIDFVEVGFVDTALEQVASIAALPGSVVEADQRRVDADVRSALKYFVSITRTNSTHERNPAGKLPLHLDVEVRRVFQLGQQLWHLNRSRLLPPQVAKADDGRQNFRIASRDGLLRHRPAVRLSTSVALC